MKLIKVIVKYCSYIIKDMPISKRLLLFFTILTTLPLLVVSIVSYDRNSSYIENVTIKNVIEANRNKIAEVNAVKTRYESTSDQILSNKYIQDLLSGKKFNCEDDQLDYYKRVKDYLNSMVDSNSIVNISVTGKNGISLKAIPDTTPLYTNFNITDSEIYKMSLKSDGENIWIANQKDVFLFFEDRPFVYLTRKIKSLDQINNEIGTSIIQLNYKIFSDILNRLNLYKGEFYTLVDSKGLIICHTAEPDLVGNKLEENLWDKLKHAQGEYFYFEDNKSGKCIIFFIKQKESPWYLIKSVPYKSIIGESKAIRNFSLIVMCSCLIIAILLSVLFSKSITQPIQRLKKSMEKIGEGNLYINLEIDRKDEIGVLQNSFNKMGDEIRNLVNSVELEHKNRRKLELQVLEYQINPHFLYNTLDSINWMAYKSGHKEIGDITIALARFFRLGLSKGKEFYKVFDEIEHATNYLLICKFRYRDCFNYRFDIDEAILNYKTIKIVLQPILENAVKYGIEKTSKDGLILVTGYIADGDIIFEVIDKGMGINTDRLEYIKETLETMKQNGHSEGGFGLINVNQRIKLAYGQNYGLNIESKFGSGTVVKIKIPVVQ